MKKFKRLSIMWSCVGVAEVIASVCYFINHRPVFATALEVIGCLLAFGTSIYYYKKSLKMNKVK